MKINIRFALIALLALLGCSSDNDSKPQSVKTVVYLIRHAEKADASANTNLSAAGLQRADNPSLLFTAPTTTGHGKPYSPRPPVTGKK